MMLTRTRTRPTPKISTPDCIGTGDSHNPISNQSHRPIQGCGLGLETVSRRTNVSSQSRLEKNCQRLGLGSQTSRSRLGLGYLRLVPKTNFRPNCAGHSTQCEWALDVVSLCCSYYCSSYQHAKNNEHER